MKCICYINGTKTMFKSFIYFQDFLKYISNTLLYQFLIIRHRFEKLDFMTQAISSRGFYVLVSKRMLPTKKKVSKRILMIVYRVNLRVEINSLSPKRLRLFDIPNEGHFFL